MRAIRPGREARRAAGRLCLVDFAGAQPSGALEHHITESRIGGVVLFRKNVTSAAQTAELINTIQAIARKAGAPVLWITVDHEGGVVNRFPQVPEPGTPPDALRVTPLPSAMALGATGDPGLAREAGSVAGRELRALGVHLDFAPVLDVNNNPANPVIGARAFGESPDLVEAMGLAYLEGLQSAGVGATAKHFPGHGDVTIDSHLALPRVKHDLARLDAVDLRPFAAAARAGVAAIMTAHIIYDALDASGLPATMSAPILTGLLRDRWGYQGVACTDSLSMRAIADHFGVGEAAVAAVGAGCDLVLALGPEPLQEEVLESLARAIEHGAISSGRVAEAMARLDAAAKRWREPEASSGPAMDRGAKDQVARRGTKDAGEAVTGLADHDARLGVASRIAEAAITLVRDRVGMIPLGAGLTGVVPLAPASADRIAPDLTAALRRHGARVREFTPGDPDPMDNTTSLVAVTCSRGRGEAEQAAAVRRLHQQAGDRLVVLAAGDPYDLLQVPEVPAYLTTYGPDVPSLDAAARVLLGRIRPRGRLPVTLPGLYPVGHGVGSG